MRIEDGGENSADGGVEVEVEVVEELRKGEEVEAWSEFEVG